MFIFPDAEDFLSFMELLQEAYTIADEEEDENNE
jgi:hypothetical protein